MSAESTRPSAKIEIPAQTCGWWECPPPPPHPTYNDGFCADFLFLFSCINYKINVNSIHLVSFLIRYPILARVLVYGNPSWLISWSETGNSRYNCLSKWSNKTWIVPDWQLSQIELNVIWYLLRGETEAFYYE